MRSQGGGYLLLCDYENAFMALLGDLPAEVAYTTVFSAGVGSAALHDPVRQAAVREFFQFIAADQQHPCRQSFGMR